MANMKNKKDFVFAIPNRDYELNLSRVASTDEHKKKLLKEGKHSFVFVRPTLD